MTARNLKPTVSASSIERIHHAAATASPALQPVARWLAANSLVAATITIEDVAAASGGSVSSVNRFARHAGYSGFAGLKADLAVAVRQALLPVDKLASQGAPTTDLETEIASHQRNLTALASPLQQRGLDDAVRRLVASRAVYCLGLGLSNYLAGMLADGLMPYHGQVIHAAGAGGTEQAARHLLRIGSQDFLVAISLPRYSRDTVELVRFARDRHSYTLALTDSPTAPLAAAAHATLLAPATHSVLSSSAVAMVALIESLTAGVLRITPGASALAADLSQAVLRYLSFEQAPRASRSSSKRSSSS